ncbi:MAG: rRNA maturation RNAse YbeY, partial [Ginsengibacter sp.]
MEKILFRNNGISPGFSPTKDLKIFLISIFQNEKVDLKTLSYIFCKDDYLLTLNREYLNHDSYTDILTFTLSDLSSAVISEIYISIERVRENAVK